MLYNLLHCNRRCVNDAIELPNCVTTYSKIAPTFTPNNKLQENEKNNSCGRITLQQPCNANNGCAGAYKPGIKYWNANPNYIPKFSVDQSFLIYSNPPRSFNLGVSFEL